MTPKILNPWVEMATASYGNQFIGRAKVCVVATRYGGGYEGGTFAAISIDDLDSSAFGQDLAASEWWEENASRVGVGNTPDAALKDWFEKQGAAIMREVLA